MVNTWNYFTAYMVVSLYDPASIQPPLPLALAPQMIPTDNTKDNSH
jgi:hypothetical protein